MNRAAPSPRNLLRSTLAWLLFVAGLASVLTGVWWLGGYSVCSEFMARYDMTAGVCVGGKLLGETHSLSWNEQSIAFVREAAAWALVAGYLVVAYFFRLLLRSAHRHSGGQHEA